MDSTHQDLINKEGVMLPIEIGKVTTMQSIEKKSKRKVYGEI